MWQLFQLLYFTLSLKLKTISCHNKKCFIYSAALAGVFPLKINYSCIALRRQCMFTSNTHKSFGHGFKSNSLCSSLKVCRANLNFHVWQHRLKKATRSILTLKGWEKVISFVNLHVACFVSAGDGVTSSEMMLLQFVFVLLFVLISLTFIK